MQEEVQEDGMVWRVGTRIFDVRNVRVAGLEMVAVDGEE